MRKHADNVRVSTGASQHDRARTHFSAERWVDPSAGRFQIVAGNERHTGEIREDEPRMEVAVTDVLLSPGSGSMVCCCPPTSTAMAPPSLKVMSNVQEPGKYTAERVPGLTVCRFGGVSRSDTIRLIGNAPCFIAASQIA